MVNESVIDSVTAANFKNLGDAPAFYAALAMGDAVAHQRGVNAIREAAIGSIIDRLISVDPTESISVLKQLSGNDLAATIAQLLSALGSNQQAAKVSQTTPPVTP